MDTPTGVAGFMEDAANAGSFHRTGTAMVPSRAPRDAESNKSAMAVHSMTALGSDLGPSFSDLTALQALNRRLADDGSVGTVEDLEGLDVEGAAASTTKNFFVSVLNAEPFIPGKLATIEESRTPVQTSGSHALPAKKTIGSAALFPWLLHEDVPHSSPIYSTRDIPEAAAVAAILDIRQMIRPSGQQCPHKDLSTWLMDWDLSPEGKFGIIPGADSLLWKYLPVKKDIHAKIRDRLRRIRMDDTSIQISWRSENELWIDRHKVMPHARDIESLEVRWHMPQDVGAKRREMARVIALYAMFDVPNQESRCGLHLSLEPAKRRTCDFELFASPFNAEVPNGRYASKFPHVEWQFGSAGRYPEILQELPLNSHVSISPPICDSYLSDVMRKIKFLKQNFRIAITIPIQDAPWRSGLHSVLPGASLLSTSWDATCQRYVKHQCQLLLWEDPSISYFEKR